MLTSLTTYKTRAGIAVSTHDDELTILLAEAESIIQKYIGRILEDTGTDRTEYYNGTGQNVIQVNAYPITSITSLGYLSGVSASVPTYTNFTSSDYYFNSSTGEVVRFVGTGFYYFQEEISNKFVTFYEGIKNIRIVYRGGYTSSTVPNDLASAIYDLTGILMQGRDGTKRTASQEDILAFLKDRVHQYKRIDL